MDAVLEKTMQAVADNIGMKPEWLYNVIALESAWKPNAYNAVTGATGLIQFIPRTMKDMGVLSPTLAAKIPVKGAVPSDIKAQAKTEFLAKYPNIEAQLNGPVRQYLRMYGPYSTEQSAYLAVFYPAYRNKPLSELFPDSVRAANPGINTVGDYVAAVKKKIGIKNAIKVGTGFAAIAGIGLLGYYLYRKR